MRWFVSEYTTHIVHIWMFSLTIDFWMLSYQISDYFSKKIFLFIFLVLVCKLSNFTIISHWKIYTFHTHICISTIWKKNWNLHVFHSSVNCNWIIPKIFESHMCRMCDLFLGQAKLLDVQFNGNSISLLRMYWFLVSK